MRCRLLWNLSNVLSIHRGLWEKVVWGRTFHLSTYRSRLELVERCAIQVSFDSDLLKYSIHILGLVHFAARTNQITAWAGSLMVVVRSRLCRLRVDRLSGSLRIFLDTSTSGNHLLNLLPMRYRSWLLMKHLCGQRRAQGLHSLVHGCGSLVIVTEEVFWSVSVLGHFDAADADGL